MSSWGQILIPRILYLPKDLATTLLSSWTHIFDSLRGISILNISKVTRTHHIQTLYLLPLSKNMPLFLPGSPLTWTVSSLNQVPIDSSWKLEQSLQPRQGLGPYFSTSIMPLFFHLHCHTLSPKMSTICTPNSGYSILTVGWVPHLAIDQTLALAIE